MVLVRKLVANVTAGPRAGSQWMAAIDAALLALDVDLRSRVACLGVSGQQHGSVFWTAQAESVLSRLDPLRTPQSQLAGAFVEPHAPIWMDTSTGRQCKEMADKLGGDAVVARVTGSRPFPRFTGPQIAKRFERQEYRDQTSRISLVSSFLTSLLLGRVAPIDESDAGGTNLLDLDAREWWGDALDFAGRGVALQPLLGRVVPTCSALGTVSAAAAARYGFPVTALVAAGSGDNPCTVAGMGIASPSTVGVSLGTSDTLFFLSDDVAGPDAEGHVFVSPLPPWTGKGGRNMHMLCWRNGALTRQRLRDRVMGATGSWGDVEKALRSDARPDARGTLRVGCCFLLPEIVPRLPYPCAAFAAIGPGGSVDVVASAGRAFGESEALASCAEQCARQGWSPAQVLASAVLGHALGIRLHAEALGVRGVEAVVVAGGASASKALVQVIANVFGAPVFAAPFEEAAAAGAALRARNALAAREGSGRCLPHGLGRGSALLASPEPWATRELVAAAILAVRELECRCLAAQGAEGDRRGA